VKFNVGELVRIKREYYDDMGETDHVELIGVITEITESSNHSIESIRKLASHMENPIDIIKIMMSDGKHSEWFDDELEKFNEEEA
jgi:hypothetical protein